MPEGNTVRSWVERQKGRPGAEALLLIGSEGRVPMVSQVHSSLANMKH